MNTKYNIVIFLLMILVTLGSCETLDLDINDNPNTTTPDSADAQLFLNGIMVSFLTWAGDHDVDNEAGWDAGMEVVRMLQASGQLYENLYGPTDFNDIWRGYAGHLKDIQDLKTIATKDSLFHHVGVAQIIESYSMTTLVDYFGDVPYSEAWLGAENLNPKVDDGQAVYGIAMTLLDDAITNLETTVSVPLNSSSDVFYSGTTASWITLAKSLKFRIYNNTRLVDAAASLAGMNALLADGDVIDTMAEDWVISYGTNTNNPDNRHPQYVDNYQGGPSGEYMSLYFMNLLANRVHTDPDPRIRYYLYRQVSAYPDPTTAQGLFDLPCLAAPFPSHYTPGQDPFCTSVGGGYWGRPHLFTSGLPSDGGKITTWGAYPAGGKFDNNDFRSANVTSRAGLSGKGIHPLLLSSFVHFMRAEAALELGTTDDAAVQLEAGIRASIARTQAILDGATFSREPDAGDIGTYVTDILVDYNAADAAGKLDVIMTQAYIASWGNPVEAYNNYRRTSMPANIHPSSDPNPGVFIRSFRYPANAINSNSNIDPKPNTGVRVFWDKNDDNLDF